MNEISSGVASGYQFKFLMVKRFTENLIKLEFIIHNGDSNLNQDLPKSSKSQNQQSFPPTQQHKKRTGDVPQGVRRRLGGTANFPRLLCGGSLRNG